jgi:hypothetical protein
LGNVKLGLAEAPFKQIADRKFVGISKILSEARRQNMARKAYHKCYLKNYILFTVMLHYIAVIPVTCTGAVFARFSRWNSKGQQGLL